MDVFPDVAKQLEDYAFWLVNAKACSLGTGNRVNNKSERTGPATAWLQPDLLRSNPSRRPALLPDCRDKASKSIIPLMARRSRSTAALWFAMFLSCDTKHRMGSTRVAPPPQHVSRRRQRRHQPRSFDRTEVERDRVLSFIVIDVAALPTSTRGIVARSGTARF